MSDSYRTALAAAQAEVKDLLLQRAHIDQKLAKLNATVTALTNLLSESPKPEEPADLGDMGITEAIRQVLNQPLLGGLTPADIKGKLTESGFDLNKYANAGAVIHSTLKRLEAQGEIVPVQTFSGAAAYTRNWATTGLGFGTSMADYSKVSNLALLATAMGVNKSEGGSK